MADGFSDENIDIAKVAETRKLRGAPKGVEVKVAQGFGVEPRVVQVSAKPKRIAAAVKPVPVPLHPKDLLVPAPAPAPAPVSVSNAALDAAALASAPALAEKPAKGVRFAPEAEVDLIDLEALASAPPKPKAAAAPAVKPKLKPEDIKVRSLKGTLTIPDFTPADIDAFTQMTGAEFVDPTMTAVKKELVNQDPVEAKPVETTKIAIPNKKFPDDRTKDEIVALPIYRPISAASFSDFVIETYKRYSPELVQIEEEIAKGLPPTVKEKELDPDACLKRDPNKVETFYYQKFVRDYLGRDTPYRGLLVYHGLGSGKTCTSIAAAEALHWGGLKRIFILTPATLSANYQRELGKCGYYPLRRHNHWAFLKSTASASARAWLVDRWGLPASYVDLMGGGWVANPKKASNWDSLTETEQSAIIAQQEAHMKERFTFIHYNGISPETLAGYAAKGIFEGKSLFDDAVVVIDEVHNLVRTINGTRIGGKSIPEFIKATEPREPNWSTPKYREIPGYRYPRGYSLYRLLQNAVNTKIVALSATPMINYAQEFAVLMNMVGGEQRMASISLKLMRKNKDYTREITEWAKAHPEIDFFAIEEGTDRMTTVLNVTPVPHGYVKVVGADFQNRGFVRPPNTPSVVRSRERNMDIWAISLVKELESMGVLAGGGSAEAEAAVATARAKGPGNAPVTNAFTLFTFPMLPEDQNEFVANFIDRATLKILNGNILRARASGLISFYRGGAEDLMPRSERVDVRVPMSDYMFKQYTAGRMRELELDRGKEKKPEEGEAAIPAKKVKGKSGMELDLYAQATKTQSSGFLALSRAACNWVYPEDIERPDMTLTEEERIKLREITQDTIIAADAFTELPEGGGGAAAAAPKPVATEGDEVAAPPEEPLSATLTGIVGTLMTELEAKGENYLRDNLAVFSPKYAVMLENIRTCPGPVLVYSQFKTLEGLGIFAAALRAATEQYLPLDIQRNAEGEWEIPAALMDPAVRDRPRYIMYTGDQELEKRRLLLQLYNADVGGLPPTLSGQCRELLGTEPDNRKGVIAKIFMITQSGAEGISLFNTRQVHIMEPYWNNVRIQQVIGRAIRLCSHMHLPWDERTVTVFTYLSVFSDEQKGLGAKEASSKLLMMLDKEKTTDEMINEIATTKQKLSDGLFEIAQSAAVDCQLHFFEHGKTTQCFSFPPGARPLFMYHPDWHKDIVAGAMRAVGK